MFTKSNPIKVKQKQQQKNIFSGTFSLLTLKQMKWMKAVTDSCYNYNK